VRHGPHLFGKTLGQAFGVSDAQTLLLKSGNATLAAITYVNSSTGQHDATNPQAPERGFTIPVHLAQPNSLNWASWVDDRYTHTPHWRRGSIGIFDLESLPRVLRDTPFEVIHFNIPRATLNAFTEDAELPNVERLHCPEGQSDPVLYHLAEMIRPYIVRKIELPQPIGFRRRLPTGNSTSRRQAGDVEEVGQSVPRDALLDPITKHQSRRHEERYTV
jgi:hypothetical protein